MSSMYNDASLALIPSAVGDGVVYNARPVEVLGAELVTNGDFATDSDWTKEAAWTISNSVASVTSSGNDRIYQSVSLDASKKYLLNVNVISISSGSIRFRFGAQGSASNLSEITTPGIHTFETEPISGTSSVGLFAVSGTTAIIDNVSVKEVLTSAQDFDFTRASEATRVLSGGRIEKVRTNRVLYSEDLSNAAWGKERSTVTSNAIANPLDGAVTADKIVVDSTADNNHSVYTLAKYDSTNVQTFSVYLKAGEYTWAAIGNENSTYRGWFDLANGVVGSQNGGVTSASISDAGGGWYRCSLVIIGWPVNGIQMFATPSDATLNTVGVGSGGFYSYGVQLEQGLVATEYIATTSTSVSVGSVNDMPRLDWSGGCPALLLEPSRTNLITYSEYFGASYWTKSGSTIVENATTSPDGSLNASKLVEGTGAGAHRLRATNATITPGTVTQTIFAKAAERTWILVQENDMGGYYFNLSTGVVGSSSGLPDSNTITSVGDGWYKITVTITTANAFAKFSLYPATGDNSSSYTGDGSSGIYIYGAQLEAGNFSTSYIPSYGTATTRAADVCANAGSASTFNSEEGVLYAEISALANDGVSNRLSISDGTISDRVFIAYNTSNEVWIMVNVGGAVRWQTTNAIDITVFHKIAVRWANADFSLWVDGSEVDSQSSGTTFPASTLTELSFDDGGGGNDFYGNTKQILVFNTALSDTELEKLTTL